MAPPVLAGAEARPDARAPDSPQVRALGAQYRFGPAAYAANLLLAFWKPPVAMALCLAEAVIFLLPPRAPRGR